MSFDLTPEDIPRMCRELDIIPMRGTGEFVLVSDEGTECGCCVGIQLIASGASIDKIIDRCDSIGMLTKRIQEPRELAIGMSTGWEDGLQSEWDMIMLAQQSNDYQRGFRFGMAAWKACVDAGLAEDE